MATAVQVAQTGAAEPATQAPALDAGGFGPSRLARVLAQREQRRATGRPRTARRFKLDLLTEAQLREDGERAQLAQENVDPAAQQQRRASAVKAAEPVAAPEPTAEPAADADGGDAQAAQAWPSRGEQLRARKPSTRRARTARRFQLTLPGGWPAPPPSPEPVAEPSPRASPPARQHPPRTPAAGLRSARAGAGPATALRQLGVSPCEGVPEKFSSALLRSWTPGPPTAARTPGRSLLSAGTPVEGVLERPLPAPATARRGPRPPPTAIKHTPCEGVLERLVLPPPTALRHVSPVDGLLGSAGSGGAPALASEAGGSSGGFSFGRGGGSASGLGAGGGACSGGAAEEGAGGALAEGLGSVMHVDSDSDAGGDAGFLGGFGDDDFDLGAADAGEGHGGDGDGGAGEPGERGATPEPEACVPAPTPEVVLQQRSPGRSPVPSSLGVAVSPMPGDSALPRPRRSLGLSRFAPGRDGTPPLSDMPDLGAGSPGAEGGHDTPGPSRAQQQQQQQGEQAKAQQGARRARGGAGGGRSRKARRISMMCSPGANSLCEFAAKTPGPDAGARRSQREKRAPLQWWRNEHKEYSRPHRSLPTVDHIETRTPDPRWEYVPDARRRKAPQARGKGKGAAGGKAGK